MPPKSLQRDPGKGSQDHGGAELPSPAVPDPLAEPPAAASSQPRPKASCWAWPREEEEGRISKAGKTMAYPGARARPLATCHPPSTGTGGYPRQAPGRCPDPPQRLSLPAGMT